MKNSIVTNISYADDYIYNSANPYAVTGTSSGAEFCWDDAGNMAMLNDNSGTNLYYWTEDNRMQALITDKTPAFYRYDAGGERELKLLAHITDVGTNGRPFLMPVYDNAVLYASQLLTIDNKNNYKKHYFMGSERFLTVIGGGRRAASPPSPSLQSQPYTPLQPNTQLQTITGDSPQQLSVEYFNYYVVPYFTEHENNCKDNPLPAEASFNVPDLQMSFEYFLNQNVRDIPYYWLADRIGSGSIVTNSAGNPVHVLANIPFGENLLDLSSSTASETPYKFAGYEHDQESGLQYAHARYYGGMKRYPIFLSPDPMWSKYPHLSPYAYCANNPINAIDSDGQKIVFLIRNYKGEVREQLTYRNGNFWHSDGTRYNPQKENLSKTLYKTLAAYRKILNSGDKTLIKQITTLETSERTHWVEEGSENAVFHNANGRTVTEDTKIIQEGQGVGTQTTFDFSASSKKDFESVEGVKNSDFTTVVHEMQHQYDYDQGNMKDNLPGNSAKDPAEVRAVKNENRARKIENLPKRTTYGGEKIKNIE